MNQELKIFLSPLFSPFTQIKHGFFSRKGGVSQGMYESLNVCYDKGDKKYHVSENRNLIERHFSASNPPILLIPQQEHTEKVLILEEPFISPPVVDGLVTQKKGLLIGVQTADCVPLLMVDPKKQIIAAVHAGWKGTLKGIPQKAVKKMMALGADIKDIYASIGPCISQESYEVGEEVFKAFTSKDHSFKDHFKQSGRANHYLFDLPGVVYMSLKKEGVEFIHNTHLNTYTDETYFFSCRRSTHRGESVFGTCVSSIMIC